MVLDLGSSSGYKAVIDLLKQHFQRKSIVPTKKVSNEIVEYSATNNDFSLLFLAIIAYVLYKTMTQNHIVNGGKWKQNRELILNFLDSLDTKRNNLQQELPKFIALLKNVDFDAYHYMLNIEKKGRVKVGARLYSMGFSQVKIKEILNVDPIELQQYLADSVEHNQKQPEDLIRGKVEFLVDEEKKNLVFDSSALISIGSNGLWSFFEEFKKRNPKINFYITQGVYDETIKIKEKVVRFGWLSIQMEYLVKAGIFEIISAKNLKESKSLAEKANNIFYTKHGKLEILQEGELESVVFAKTNNAILVIDEIVTRWLVEEPKRLHALMEQRYKEKVLYNEKILSDIERDLGDLPVIRSVDFIAFGIKKGYFKKYEGMRFARHLLYAIKHAGCATTYEEIDKFVKEDLKEVFENGKKEAFN